MRLGLYGGTFDPIHQGHLILAEACREACRLDRVWFVVAGSPPHKPGERTAVADRVEMVRIAIAGNSAFEVSEIETKRPGPHYSIETIEAIHREQPNDELFFLIGADSLVDLSLWREPERILRMTTLVVVNRPGVEPKPLDLGGESREPIFVTVPPIGIASKDLRRRREQGLSIRDQGPRGVEAYIEAHGLYRPVP